MSIDTKALEALRADLALARQKHDEKKADLDEARAAWEEAHRTLIESERQLRDDAKTADDAFREAALEAYAIDPENRKPVEGVEVKLWDAINIEASEAETWARANMPALLVLDDKAYKKVLKEVNASKTLSSIIAMPGMVRQEPKVSVSRDLSAYVPEA